MRLFVGLDIDEPIRERITSFVRELKQNAPDVRFVSPQTYHLTLKFLGETHLKDEIDAALQTIKIPQFEVSYRGVGFFPNARQPRIFWVGVHAGPALQDLAASVANAMERLGFERENSFKPHLTLARSGSGRPRPKSGDRADHRFHQLHAILARIPEPEFGTMTAREFILYESKLSPGGAQYFPQGRYELRRRD